MGSGEILGHINTFLQSINKYFNPIGKFYIQVQVLCRVLVCSVFLDDLFKSSGLECDSKQVACQQNCVNRFAPLNHKKIWEFELFMVMLAIVIFLAFSLYNDYVINQQKKKYEKEKIAQAMQQQSSFDDYLVNKKKSMRKRTKKEKEFYKSNITSTGYLVMLIVRLAFEIFFLWLENQLGKHQSQNVEFWNSFWLKESWLCATNTPNGPEQESLDKILPPSNRSEVFWTEDWNMACLQQKVSVTCWIPFSRMKSYGMIFMYWVLIVNTILTFLELCLEVVRLCKSASKNNNRQQSVQNYNNVVNMQSVAESKVPIISDDYVQPDYHNKDTQPIVVDHDSEKELLMRTKEMEARQQAVQMS